MRYTQEQISAALLLLKATDSPTKVIQTLGYPSSPMLYHWRDNYPEYYDVPDQKRWKQAPSKLKRRVIKRCFIDSESVKIVAEEIGYTLSLIYKWIREYREKAVIIDALKNKYSLPMLCVKLNLAKSGYYYQKKAIHTEDKYLKLRQKIIQLFHDNRDIFGYRKIHMLLRNEGTIVSENVVRRIKKQEALIVKQRHKHKCNSYKDEITLAVENVIDRDFHADKPNQKWLTEITEFSIKAGKVYLSPMIDCLDGTLVTWTIETSPNSKLANTMLKNAIATLYPGEKPIDHSDRGCHYR